ncbi:MAG: hypothetical protein GEU82_10775 [Luteitalea sp.]|nr:hypothetical protein [Luteitalea sp.]
MSSETSTENVRRGPDSRNTSSAVVPAKSAAGKSGRFQADRGAGLSGAGADPGLQPWQFFVLAALGCATAVTFLVRSQGVTVVILLSVLMGAAALVGLAMLRTVRPLITGGEDRTVVIGHRTRTALEREKALTLRTIKELEFDRAMGKVSEEDFREMTGKLRSRATRLIRQLDASAGYRTVIERELTTRLGDSKDDGSDTAGQRTRPDGRVCAGCSTSNDADARFCKSCGAKL